MSAATSSGHHEDEPQGVTAGGQDDVLGHDHLDGQDIHVEDVILRLLTRTLGDIESVRKATEHRLWTLEKRGLSPEMHAGVLVTLAHALRTLEGQADDEVRRFMGQHRYGPFVKTINGLGYKQVARLLGEIGDPASRPNVAKLRQYCGHGDPSRSRRSQGAVIYDDEGLPKLPFNPEAKMRVHLIAMKCVQGNGAPDKNGRPRGLSPYRAVYDDAKAAWADRDTTDGHKHNHALKMVGKQILLDLWVEGRRLRGLSRHDPHEAGAPEPCGQRDPTMTRSGAAA